MAELCPRPWVRALGRPQLLAPGVWRGALSTSPLQGNGTGEARDMYVPNPSCKEFAKYEWIGQIMGAALRGKDFLVSPMRRGPCCRSGLSPPWHGARDLGSP